MFVGLVVLHELGHAIVARRNKVEVEEFGIGFPPRAWGKKLKNGTFFSLNWLPLGGFVKLKGEHDSADGPGTYGGASLWAKTKILLAGVVVNWLTAAVIFTILALIGLPKILPNQFTVAADTNVVQNNVIAAQIGENSPAQKAGLQQGDALLKFAGQDVKSADHFRELTKANAGQTVPVSVTRGNEAKEVNVTLNKESENGRGFVGIGLAEQTLQRSTWSAPIVGVGVTTQFTVETLKGLGTVIGHLFKSEFAQAGQNVAGPVGIFSILKTSSDLGITPVLFLIGIISLTLAVMNALPIPALDGGRLFVTLIFRALKKPLTKKREEAIQAAGFIALMTLVVLITIVDVGRFF
ncbi:MAG: M50 family metallopeptidase [Candidatus Saccharimonadales bacterium]